MTRPIAAGALVAASIVFLGYTAGIAQTPEAQVDQRQEQMKKFGDSVKAITAFVKQGSGSVEGVQQAAATLEEGAGRLTRLFPEGTEVGVSDSAALPAIWQEPDDFAERIQALQSAVSGFSTAAGGGDRVAIAAAFANVGQSCGGCHENFRQKKEDRAS